MVKSYNFQTDTTGNGRTNLACELTAASNPYTSDVSGCEDDVKQKTAEAGAAEEVTNGMPPGVRPGDKEDPFRVYRYIKQTCLVGVWMCIVSTSSVISGWYTESSFFAGPQYSCHII